MHRIQADNLQNECVEKRIEHLTNPADAYLGRPKVLLEHNLYLNQWEDGA